MFCFAAHSGACRSEMLRARIRDVDLEAATVTIHERKRARGQAHQPAGGAAPVPGRRAEGLAGVPPGRPTPLLPRVAGLPQQDEAGEHGPLTGDEAGDHFKRTLAGSKWPRHRGGHVFRHSFVSNCAARGVDQRLIDDWVGHTTEEMRRRYRHLIPHQRQAAIRLVFGDGQ